MKRCICLIILVFLFSCEDRKPTIITDFSKSVMLKLPVVKGKAYSSYILKLHGEVDDTIYIKSNLYKAHRFIGKIDTLIISDFYGEADNIELQFEPYKAKKGTIEITYWVK